MAFQATQDKTKLICSKTSNGKQTYVLQGDLNLTKPFVNSPCFFFIFLLGIDYNHHNSTCRACLHWLVCKSSIVPITSVFAFFQPFTPNL